MAFTADDRIFLGEGLFETLKVEKGEPCHAYLHWQRLCHAAKQLSIPFDLSYEHWQKQLMQVIQKDKLLDGGIKAILSGGSAPRGLTEQGQSSQLVYQTFRYTPQISPLRL